MIINSSLKKYKVEFSNSIDESLSFELQQACVIIIDENVFKLLDINTQKTIVDNNHFLINANEKQKSYSEIESLIKELIALNFKKNNKIICIGGGISQDIAAFISSIIFRGVDWVFFPTTLLAQADSCIGGKTSINIGEFKNQIGNFYPPSKVYIIPKFLRFLSELDFKSGMGEMLHFYLVSGKEDFKFYNQNYENAFKDDKALNALIKLNLQIKKRFIEEDEFDTGKRLLLNYGHSFGHALESVTNYKIPHGIAVSYGMDIANYISVKLGLLDEETRDIVKKTIDKITLGIDISKISVEKFTKALSNDKKNIDKSYRLILTRGIGKMEIIKVEPSEMFNKWLEEYFYNYSNK